jgi:Caspase domain
MTRNAYALVVGIDRYDDNGIPVLSGSVYDAKIAVAWLLKIGVPPERIHLHVSPLPAPPASFSGVSAASARLDAILGSLEALSKEKGDQLFLFLSGHGLNVPGAAGGPIFLAQDYGAGLASSQKNMRMYGFIQWILSWPFRDQFLFYDACQNPSTSVGRVSLVKAIDPPMLDALPVAVTSGMLACFSASPGQTAWAGTGEGVLVRHVLNELDPDALAQMPLDAQQQDSVMYNWLTGSRRLDLRRLYGTIVAPAVTEEAAEAGNAQAPICVPYGTALASLYSPILDLPDEPTVDLTINLLPLEATAAVKALRLSIQTPARNAFLPDAGKKLANPLLCKGPVAAEVIAFCSPKPGSGWRTLDSPKKAVLGDQPATITFNFDMPPPADPPGPPDMFNIRVTGPDGSPLFPLGGAYEKIATSNGLDMDLGEGVSFNHHEHGPDIGFDASIAGAPERAARSATDWLSAIRRHISDQNMSAIIRRALTQMERHQIFASTSPKAAQPG